MYAFVSVSPDGNTLQSLVYYDQGETPGLGGEIENPAWAGQFKDKKLYDAEWKPALTLVKGGANPASNTFAYEVDGLSGATLTANGVQATFDFWMGDMGFGPFLANLRNGGLNNG
jgi:Na+-transporting NADH:ubiquinone oxidoreductase subunit C